MSTISQRTSFRQTCLTGYTKVRIIRLATPRSFVGEGQKKGTGHAPI